MGPRGGSSGILGEGRQESSWRFLRDPLGRILRGPQGPLDESSCGGREGGETRSKIHSVKCVPLVKVIQLFKSVASVLLSASTHKAFTREPVVALFDKTFLVPELVPLLPSMENRKLCARFLRNTETGTQTEVQFNGVAGDIMSGHPPYRPLKTLLGDP